MLPGQYSLEGDDNDLDFVENLWNNISGNEMFNFKGLGENGKLQIDGQEYEPREFWQQALQMANAEGVDPRYAKQLASKIMHLKIMAAMAQANGNGQLGNLLLRKAYAAGKKNIDDSMKLAPHYKVQ